MSYPSGSPGQGFHPCGGRIRVPKLNDIANNGPGSLALQMRHVDPGRHGRNNRDGILKRQAYRILAFMVLSIKEHIDVQDAFTIEGRHTAIVPARRQETDQINNNLGIGRLVHESLRDQRNDRITSSPKAGIASTLNRIRS